MDLESLFSLAGKVALVGWIALIVAPRWRPSAQIIAQFLIPGALGALYLALIATHWSGHRGGFSSLSGVAELFEDRSLLLAGWVHYLAFDLFIGAWEVRDAARERITHWLVAPCLILTFLFGPIGLLTYFIIRGVRRWVARSRGVAGATAPVGHATSPASLAAG